MFRCSCSPLCFLTILFWCFWAIGSSRWTKRKIFTTGKYKCLSFWWSDHLINEPACYEGVFQYSCVQIVKFNFCLAFPAAGADHQAPLAAFPPVLTFWTVPPHPPPPRTTPSCCGSSEPHSPSTFCSCCSSAWPALCPWRRRITAATTPTTSPAPSIPCCATPTDLRPYEEQLNLSTYCFAKDSTECFLLTLCPKATDYEVTQRWYEDSLTLHTPLSHLSTLQTKMDLQLETPRPCPTAYFPKYLLSF